MPRYKLTIEYDGTPFVGWQVQDNGVSVQGVITEAIAAFTGEHVALQGAGRTDAGVHALGQVAHVDLIKDWDVDTVRDAINFHLRPQPIAVLTAESVADTFEARFSAIKRHYLYRIINRRADLALEQNRAWRVPRPLDSAAMHTAAQQLIGRHDFTTFRATECQAKSPVKTLDQLDVARDGDEVGLRRRRARSCIIRCARWSARSSMSAKASGARTILRAALAARDRAACGQVAPPHGLYLVRVEY